jgi:hypothetical protein
MDNPKKEKKGMSKGLKVFLWVAGAAVTGGLIYAGWKYFSKSKDDDDTVPYTPLPTPAPVPAYTGTSSYTAPKKNDGFPLKRGSKGDNVKKLQQALIKKYGASILPKYGADGDFGSEMETALSKNGWDTTVQEDTFNVIVGSTVTPVETFAPKSIAKALYNAAKAKDFSTALANIKKLNSTSDYSDVSTEFKALRLNNVATTLVTGMLKTFTSTSQKDQFKQQFLRIGLKYDSSADKWSLSGLGELPQIITLHNTTVWAYPNQRIAVEGNTILGNPIANRNGYTLFQTLDGQHQLLVKSTSIKEL